MAIALDAVASTKSIVNQLAGGTTTYAHTVTSNTNGLIALAVGAWNNGGTGTGLSGATYAGVAMTKISASSSLTAGGTFYTEIWYLIAPSTGTNNVIATVSGKTDALGLASLSLTGVDQTTPVDTAGTFTGTTGIYTKAITTTAAADWMLDITSHLSANTASSNTGGTSIFNNATGGVGTASQYGTAATAGTNSMTWTYPDVGDIGTYSIAAFLASGGGGGGGTAKVSTQMMMGV
jgi:hypothetical protein